MKNPWWIGPAIVLIVTADGIAADRKKSEVPTALDRYVAESEAQSAAAAPASPGSVWTPNAQFTGLGLDPRAARPGDLLTIVVAESASAVATGGVKTQRASSAGGSLTAGGSNSPLAQSVSLATATALDGQGSTSRAATLSTTMTVHVARVLPNGNLLIEGQKAVGVNSEQQIVSLRGVVRPLDIASDNSLSSDRIAQMEISVNGKGVVGSSIRRPSLLYRVLLGILPF